MILKEARRLKKFIEEMKKKKHTVTYNHNDNLLQDLEIVLQALDNSIPKEKVEKRLNNIEEMLDKTARGELQKCTPSELILIRIIYNELLEEDNEK